MYTEETYHIPRFSSAYFAIRTIAGKRFKIGLFSLLPFHCVVQINLQEKLIDSNQLFNIPKKTTEIMAHVTRSLL
jgi:hypothetical protein